MAAARIDDGVRARLAVVLDLLAPAGDGMPAASEVDAAGVRLDRILDADPSLVEPVVAIAACGTWDELEAFQASDAATFERAVFGLLSAYYLHPGVRKRMGYPGQGPAPILADEPEHYLRDGIIDPVVARGPIYVPTPDA